PVKFREGKIFFFITFLVSGNDTVIMDQQIVLCLSQHKSQAGIRRLAFINRCHGILCKVRWNLIPIIRIFKWFIRGAFRWEPQMEWITCPIIIMYITTVDEYIMFTHLNDQSLVQVIPICGMITLNPTIFKP